jgi:phage-related minor tail protein
MMAALKPGFDALGEALTNAVKWRLKSLSSALGGGGLFGGGGGAGGGMDWDFMYSGGAYAHGGAFSHGVRMAFAGGGIVTRPTLFPMAGGAGLMGEAGEEGILPLSRVGGDLGVKALFPQSGPPVVNIINKTGTEAQGSAQQNDDGSLDIILEPRVLKYASRGPLNQLIKMIASKG